MKKELIAASIVFGIIVALAILRSTYLPSCVDVPDGEVLACLGL